MKLVIILKNKKKRTKIVIVIIIVACIVINIFNDYTKYKNKKDKVKHNTVEVINTTYNKIVLDSIEYKIHTKDSVIVKLKTKIKYEIVQALNATDSDAVKQFYELAGSDQ